MIFLDRLNGWQRLWFVIAVLGYALSGIYVVYEVGGFLIEDIYVLQGLNNSECAFVYSLPAGLDQLERYECYPLYEYLQSTKQPLGAAQYLEYFRSRRNDLLTSGVLLYWGLWTFIMGVAYVCGLMVRWIRRGFPKRDGKA